MLSSITAVVVVAASICAAQAAAPLTAELDTPKAAVMQESCKWLIDKRNNLTRFSALPGGGWDNLRNKDMGRVADTSFSDCKLSDEGSFVLPSNVILLIRKESAVEIMSEVMEHFSNYSSAVSRSINAETSTQFLGISGKLSDDFQRVKSVAISSKLKIGRTQLRYRLYTAKLQPDFRLSTSFASRMSDIVSAIASNRTKLARYLSDLVVRDFGTHVVTTVEAGGLLEKVDFISNDIFNSHEFTESKLSASMSLSFFSFLNMSGGINHQATKQNVEKYEKSVNKMSIRSHGGPILGADPSLDAWLRGLKENLVPVDMDGEPLNAIINRRSLPGMPVMLLLQLRKEIEGAVTRYYSANTVKGCQDPNSANFDPAANLDGHCEAAATNFSFAGVYQTCSETNHWLGACGTYGSIGGALMNPITGSFSCPLGYEEVPLLRATGNTKERCTKKTKTCYLFFTCDDGESCETSTTTLNAFWCAARRGARLQPHSGMVFGGAYATSRFINEFTQAASCPELFKPYLIGRDIVLCLSMDLQSAARYRLPLAGFFSCRSGNPLAEPNRGLVASSGRGSRSEPPKQCPDGFSQVTLDTVDGCAIMQCVKGRSGLKRQPVRRPPFEEPDDELIDRPVTRVERNGWQWSYNVNSNSWSFIGYFGSDITSAIGLKASAPSVPSTSARTPSSTPFIVVLCCLAGVMAVTGITLLTIRASGYSPSQIRQRLLRRLHRSRRHSTEPPDEEIRRRHISRSAVLDSARRAGYGTVESTEELLACSSQDDDDKLAMDDEVEVVVTTSCRKAGR